MSLEEMATRVEKALGCRFEKGELNDGDAFIAHFLGLNVHLYDWRGLGDRVVFVLASVLEEYGMLRGPGGEHVELEVQEIGDAISALLAVREGGDWHPVSDEEVAAEREHGGRINERFRRQEEEGARRIKKRYR
ncbi:hypothetical protein H480_26107 [Amycolatopsis vancoresmycina DSM 44592]|uniref:Uncharacterized protein n=2 Tax=Amycolatopsis vancoresmycina TaxID=208444 RepID=R1G252_9PSEU|nr:hypothetical protein H480_26107 [Amycolatopsis vancoresmycina DSM 44592]